jgi:hypothetical protein
VSAHSRRILGGCVDACVDASHLLGRPSSDMFKRALLLRLEAVESRPLRWPRGEKVVVDADMGRGASSSWAGTWAEVEVGVLAGSGGGGLGSKCTKRRGRAFR